MTRSKNTPEWEPTNYHSILNGCYSQGAYAKRNKMLTKEEAAAILKEEKDLQKEAQRLIKHETKNNAKQKPTPCGDACATEVS